MAGPYLQRQGLMRNGRALSKTASRHYLQRYDGALSASAGHYAQRGSASRPPVTSTPGPSVHARATTAHIITGYSIAGTTQPPDLPRSRWALARRRTRAELHRSPSPPLSHFRSNRARPPPCAPTRACHRHEQAARPWRRNPSGDCRDQEAWRMQTPTLSWIPRCSRLARPPATGTCASA